MTPVDFLKAIARRFLRLGEGGPSGAHVTRYWMYEHLGQVMAPIPKSGRVLSISESGRLCEACGLTGLPTDEANFPDHNMLALNFPDASYDFVVSDQVLEHVLGDPFLAVRESFRVLKPGGYVVHTTCLINPIHKYPYDLWRFTPDGLALLCQEHGEVIEADGWGNRMVWFVVAVGLRFRPVPHNPRSPLHRIATKNDPLWPTSTWVVARKAADAPPPGPDQASRTR